MGAPGQRETLEGDFDSGPPLRQYESRPLAGPPIVPLLLAVGPADRQVRGTRRPGPILESASLFLPLAALRRIPRRRLACSATGGAAPLSPILDFTPGDRTLVLDPPAAVDYPRSGSGRRNQWNTGDGNTARPAGRDSKREAGPIRFHPRHCTQRPNTRHKRLLRSRRSAPGKAWQVRANLTCSRPHPPTCARRVQVGNQAVSLWTVAALSKRACGTFVA